MSQALEGYTVSKVNLGPTLIAHSQREETKNEVIAIKQWFTKYSPGISRSSQDLSRRCIGKKLFS